ncbi:DUF4342 domain-containing protein [Caloranaerobacter azorensis]|uniref:Ubiquitin n=2 Tax=Caloranaerobacter azorensis TaxID=116090 RepID=A0A096BH05_9FIRM|nr:DUF4342 domain-containing protein [Caloranaerobacter azorensis]KGG80162.1 ubiquitin [Caloranaerobacter azorensis H53214]QIB26299.1 DUF4342 domain-containing protein [Caloranaerobacter azorensis]
MEITLEKIDLLRERTGVSYKEAKEILEKCNGDVVEALIYIEENRKSWPQNIGNIGDEILEKIRESIRKGNVTKILLKKDGETIMNIPVTAGAIGALLAPPATIFGLTAAFLSKCTIEIVKENGEVVRINDLAEKTIENVKKVAKRDKKEESSPEDNTQE